jgi:MarR family transcriptional regulator, organic hydroperoxide resistance regulator
MCDWSAGTHSPHTVEVDSLEYNVASIHSMETNVMSGASSGVGLTALFGDLVRLETELWDLVDRRLRRDHDLPLSWFEPLQVMDRVPGCRVADIAEALSITVGGTSKLVDRIEQAGLCHRRPNPDDARSSLLALSSSGRRRLDAAQGSFEDELDAWLGAALPTERLDSLASTLRDLRRHIADQRGSS